MQQLHASSAHFWANEIIGLVNEPEKLLGRRLIAPTTANLAEKLGNEVDGFECSKDGIYPLADKCVDLEGRAVYSVDMVRLEFDSVNDKAVMNYLDQTMLFNNVDTWTSNNIGKYRFMWIYSYADCEHGGTIAFDDGTVMEDGDKHVKIKVGYIINVKGGLDKRGFVEFNPNKCGWNARRLIKDLYKLGCDFKLVRYDLAVDVPIRRNKIRLVRDRRKYEFIVSVGGATEYLGSRNSPGRVKVYDKATEQGLNCDLTRIELTCSADMDSEHVKSWMPKCVDYAHLDLSGLSIAWTVAFGLVDDVLNDLDGLGASEEIQNKLVVERYMQMVPSRTRDRVKSVLKQGEKVVTFRSWALNRCRRIAQSYAKPIQ